MKTGEIQQLAEQFHVRPTKALGQNFLTDDSVCERIVAAANLSASDTVLEVGPGFGALTRYLIATGARVIAVEKDRHLATYLQETYGHLPTVRIVNADALQFNLSEIAGPYVFVSNMPYSITSPLLAHIVESPTHAPTRAILMMQKEVADRMRARVPDMNLLALSLQMRTSAIELVLTASPHAFWPQPEVESTVLRLMIAPEPTAQLDAILRLARIGFSQKRKQLLPTLAKSGVATKDILIPAFDSATIAHDARSEVVDIAQWNQLVLYLAKH